MKIFANHAHLMPENSWKEGSVEMLLEHLDFCEIDRAVVFPPFACQFDNNMEKANLWAWEQVRRYPDRLWPAATLFPLAPNAIDMLSICHKEGISLVKVHPSIDLHDIADSAAINFYTKAQELKITIDYHTGAHSSRLSLSKPEKFDNIAWNFPNLKLVLEHMGGRTYFEEFLAIINNHHSRRKEAGSPPCVFGGLTSNLNNSGEHMLWYIAPEKIMDLIKITGSDKLIFGLDFPWNNKERTREDIEIIMGLDISKDDKSKILGGNLAKLLDVRID